MPNNIKISLEVLLDIMLPFTNPNKPIKVEKHVIQGHDYLIIDSFPLYCFFNQRTNKAYNISRVLYDLIVKVAAKNRKVKIIKDEEEHEGVARGVLASLT